MKNILVIGSEITGINASLEHANAGEKVYLVENSPFVCETSYKLASIFGTENEIETIFEKIEKHPNIKILPRTSIDRIINENGAYRVYLTKKTARVKEELCIACGECWQVCPVTIIDRFTGGLANRKAIYRPFKHSIPAVSGIEKETPFCQASCPIGTDVREYAGLIADGKFTEAYIQIREDNPLPSVCGRVCSHFCEDMCKRELKEEPLAIRSLKRFVADYVSKMTDQIPKIQVEPPKDQRIAIIGAGPAGLTAAHDLAIFGYKTTIFEELPVTGGMLSWAIPAFRLPKDILQKEIDIIESLGVEIKTNTRVENIDDLFNQGYDAVFIAVGAPKPRKLNIPGEELKGVYPGETFLKDYNLGKEVDFNGKNVAIIGGGNTATDSARSALRIGAERVTILYRRSRAEMPADTGEICACEDERIDIQFLTAPVKILGDKKVERLECIRMELGEPDESGRRRPIPVKDSEFVIDADILIPAISRDPEIEWITDLELTKWGSIKVDERNSTSREGVFAGGDVVNGAATVIEAMADGKRAALAIDEYLSETKRSHFKIDDNVMDIKVHGEKEKQHLKKHYFSIKEEIEYKSRAEMPELPPDERSCDFSEVELGFTEDMAIYEAQRCLSCRKCIGCGICAEVCKQNAIDYDLPDENMILTVDSIILAPGIEELLPYEEKCGYTNPNVITSFQFGNLLNPDGPFEGLLLRPFDGEIPQKIAFLQCNSDSNSYSLEILLRETLMVKEKNLEAKIFLLNKDEIDEEFYNETKEKGVSITNINDFSILEDSKTHNLTLTYNVNGENKKEEFNLIVLSPGVSIHSYYKKLGEMLQISLDRNDFQKTYVAGN
ncbi:MAG: FAD-dependent oxidoreductase [Promethearchaeota archaeon]